MSCHTIQHNEPSYYDYVPFGDYMPQREDTGTVFTHPVQNGFNKARQNEFTSDILGELADSWMKLIESQLDYHGVNPVWWPETINIYEPSPYGEAR
ncbi:hypothetical protein AbraIFM66950_001117 [Aspergillus brasiliensis]|nr:hypothetical protein AbraIFM66950_001117 [Aspergillus brasiliensis]